MATSERPEHALSFGAPAPTAGFLPCTALCRTPEQMTAAAIAASGSAAQEWQTQQVAQIPSRACGDCVLTRVTPGGVQSRRMRFRLNDVMFQVLMTSPGISLPCLCSRQASSAHLMWCPASFWILTLLVVGSKCLL